MWLDLDDARHCICAGQERGISCPFSRSPERVPSDVVHTQMVLLTITPSILEALELCGDNAPTTNDQAPAEPSLDEPKVGNPISHGQILDLWKRQRAERDDAVSLEELLKGSRVFVAPAPPKPKPVSASRTEALLEAVLMPYSRASTLR